MGIQLLIIVSTIAYLSSCTETAPLQRRNTPNFRILSESTEQFLKMTEDGLVRNDASRKDATCFKLRSPGRRQIQLSTVIEGTEYFLAMDSNGEITAISEIDNEIGSGVAYFLTFTRSRCGHGQMCLEMTMGDTQCFLNFNSNHLAANSCSKSAEENREHLMLFERCTL